MPKMELYTHIVPQNTLEKYAITNLALRRLPETILIAFTDPDNIG